MSPCVVCKREYDPVRDAHVLYKPEGEFVCRDCVEADDLRLTNQRALGIAAPQAHE